MQIETCTVLTAAAHATLDEGRNTGNVDSESDTLESISSTDSESGFTSRNDKELSNKLTRDNEQSSIGLENQQHTHAAEIHVTDSTVVTVHNPLYIQEHSQTESVEVDIHDSSITATESHKPFTSISQQQESDGMIAAMDPDIMTMPQENPSGRDKESLPSRSKFHAHNQKDLVPVVQDQKQISNKKSKSDENVHEYYNVFLPHSLSIDHLITDRHNENFHDQPHEVHNRSYGMLPTKRKLPLTKLSKEELRRQYKHRPPPPKDPSRTPGPPMSSNQESTKSCVIVSQTDEPEKSCKPHNNALSYGYEDFRVEVKCKNTLATSKHTWGSQASLKEDISGDLSTTIEFKNLSSHQPSNLNLQLHSENETASTKEVHSITQINGNDVKMHDIEGESRENLDTDKERLQTTATTEQLCSTDSQWNNGSGKFEDTFAQPDAVGGHDIHVDEESEPESAYIHLEDVSFAVHELPTDLHPTPGHELPARASIEDSYFVFPRNQEEQNSLACGNNSVSETVKFISDANESQILSSDENNENHNCGAALSTCNTDPCDHNQIHASNWCSNPEDLYVNQPLWLLEANDQQISVSQKATNSSKHQYQPLILRLPNPDSQYDLATFRPLTSECSKSLQQNNETVKSHIEQDANTDAISCLHGQPNLEGTCSYSIVRPKRPKISDHYQPLLCKKQDKHPVYVSLRNNSNPQEVPVTCTSRSNVSVSVMCHNYEELDFDSAACPATKKFKSREELRKLYRHRPPPKLPPTTKFNDSKTVPSDFQGAESDTSDQQAQHHCQCSSLTAHMNVAGLQESIQEERVILSMPALSVSTKAIHQGTIQYENVNKNAEIEQGSFVQTTSLHNPLHPAIVDTSYSSCSHSLPTGAEPQSAYMPLIPKRANDKVNSDYEIILHKSVLQ